MSEQEIDLGIGSSPLPELDKGIQLPTVSAVIDGTAFDSDLMPLINGGDAAQLQTCLGDFGLVAMTAEEFMAAGTEALNNSLVQACKAGVAFWAAQESLKTSTAPGAVSNFKEWIDKSGLVERRVYECIKLAKYYSRLPENQRSKVLTIGKKQALLLAKMPQEVIDRVAENGTDVLDEAETMTYDQLRDLLKTAERRNQNLNAEVENRDAVIAKLKQRDNRDYMFLPQTHIVREECLAYQAECEVALNSLQAVFNGELFGEHITERDLRIEQIYITANVIAARATALIERIREKSMIDLPDTIASKHMLTDDEAEHWLLDYPLIERKHEAAKAKREDARPKGPGRPKRVG